MMKYFSIILILSVLLSCSGSSNPAGEQASSGSLVFVGIQNDFIPVVYFEVVIKSGSTDDPGNKQGLAWYTANYLKRGTANFDADQIEQKLRDIGGRLNIRIDREVIEISGQILLENLETYYQIFSEIILSPAFPESESGKLKSDQEQALKAIVRDDSRLALAVLQSELYQGSSYEHPAEGYFSSIATLTAADAKEFYTQHFVKNNIICGLAGSYSAEFAERFKTDLNKLAAGKLAEKEPLTISEQKRRVVLVRKEGRAQAQIRMGRLVDYDRKNSDWFPLLIANSYLGQHRESFNQLYLTIRSQRGMSYGAYSYHEHFEQAGWSKNARALIPYKPQYFSIWTYPQQWNTEFAIKMTIYQLDKLLKYGIEPEKLEQVKSFQVNYFPFLIESPPQRLKVELEQVYFDQAGFVNSFAEKIQALAEAEILPAVRKHWSADDLTIVVVCDEADRMKEELLTIETELSLPPGASGAGLEEVNKTVKNIDLKLTPDDIVIINAEELFN